MKTKLLYRCFAYASLIAISIALFNACKKRESPYQTAELRPTVNYSGDVIQYLESQKGLYDSMAAVIKKFPDIAQKLRSNDSLTLFAIPNTAFEAAVKNFNAYRDRIDSPRLYLNLDPYNTERADSGMFNYEILKDLISRYIFNGIYSYDTLSKSSGGFPIRSIYGYEMNLRAIQESSVGALQDGPKIIELSDMNYSIFRRYWKTVSTTSIASVRAKNVLVHNLSLDHEFGFASFTERLKSPTLPRVLWRAIAWHSQYPGAWGGTVSHAFDGDLNTRWHTVQSLIPPPPIFFTVDMGRLETMSGVIIQVRPDGRHDASVRDFYIEFAHDTVSNPLKADSTSWTKYHYFYEPDPLTVIYPKTFVFPEPMRARYFRFTALQSFSGQMFNADGTPGPRMYTNLDEIWFLY